MKTLILSLAIVALVLFLALGALGILYLTFCGGPAHGFC